MNAVQDDPLRSSSSDIVGSFLFLSPICELESNINSKITFEIVYTGFSTHFVFNQGKLFMNNKILLS